MSSRLATLKFSMPVTTKIATCTYCQTRVVVKLTAGMRFDLICSACGAPLQKTEFLQQPLQQPATPQTGTQPNTPWPAPADKTPDNARESGPDKRQNDNHQDLTEKYRAEKERFKKEVKKLNASLDKKNRKAKKEKQKRKKKRKGIGYWVREAIDEIEDLFD